MKIEITDKGIKPEDVFSIVAETYKFICMNSSGEWHLFENEPFYCKGNMHIPSSKWMVKSNEVNWIITKYGELLGKIKIDYSGTPEDSLFCSGD